MRLGEQLSEVSMSYLFPRSVRATREEKARTLPGDERMPMLLTRLVVRIAHFIMQRKQLLGIARRAESTTPHASAFKSLEGEAAFLAAYDAAMSLWPVPYEELEDFEGELVPGCRHDMSSSRHDIVNARVLAFLRNTHTEDRAATADRSVA